MKSRWWPWGAFGVWALGSLAASAALAWLGQAPWLGLGIAIASGVVLGILLLR